mmetsp:Transcript_48747/g.129223  ORF Transcript_48747/g.129223 Transcript_48747/m.129223 type:complete len:131 (-) Transcript_48747:424-816(-)
MGNACCCGESNYKCHDLQSTAESPRRPSAHHEAGCDPFRKEGALPSLEVEFELPLRKCRTVVLTERPLGAKFSKEGPCRVSEVNPNSHAAELGIKVGWRVKRIGDEDVLAQEPDYIRNILKAKTAILMIV